MSGVSRVRGWCVWWCVYSNGIITTPALQQLARDYTAKIGGKMVLPLNEIDEFMAVLSMDCNVSAMDVEEVDRGVQRGYRSSDYVAHRLSDGQLFDCITMTS